MLGFLSENLDYVISIFTTLFAVAGMQFKNMKIIIVSQILSNGLLAAQCIIGGTVSAGLVVILATVQTVISFTFAYKHTEFPRWLTGIFMLGFTAITVFSLVNLAKADGLTPIVTVANIITMIAAWFFAVAMVQTASWKCRLLSTCNLTLWLIYDIMVMPSGIITHIVIITFNIIAIVRNDREEWKNIFSKLSFKKTC